MYYYDNFESTLFYTRQIGVFYIFAKRESEIFLEYFFRYSFQFTTKYLHMVILCCIELFCILQ